MMSVTFTIGFIRTKDVNSSVLQKAKEWFRYCSIVLKLTLYLNEIIDTLH